MQYITRFRYAQPQDVCDILRFNKGLELFRGSLLHYRSLAQNLHIAQVSFTYLSNA